MLPNISMCSPSLFNFLLIFSFLPPWQIRQSFRQHIIHRAHTKDHSAKYLMQLLSLKDSAYSSFLGTPNQAPYSFFQAIQLRFQNLPNAATFVWIQLLQTQICALIPAQSPFVSVNPSTIAIIHLFLPQNFPATEDPSCVASIN